MRFEQEHVNDGQRTRVAIFFEFLTYPSPDRGNGHRHIVHGLYLRRLQKTYVPCQICLNR